MQSSADRRRRPALTWVVPRKVIGMGRPGDDDLGRLRSAGVRHLISLTTSPLDPDTLAEHGLSAIHLPLSDMSAPTVEEIVRFVRTLDEILADGGRVAVHCGAGLGRTGTMLACYLVSRGRSAEDALREVRRRRPGSVESREQEAAVREYETWLRP